MKTSLLSLSALFLLAATGCSASVEDGSEEDVGASEDESRAAAVMVAGSFKLYDKAGEVPDSFCDLHTSLELANGFAGPFAQLENRVGGICEIAVQPNARGYNLTAKSAGCGSRVYTGRKGRSASIKITDHRSRSCRDLVPALIIVEETTPQGKRTLFSSDVAAPAPSEWLTFSPKQCGSNPWELLAEKPSQFKDKELGKVVEFFESKGIPLEEVGFVWPTEARAHCLACQCARGDRLVVKANGAAAAKLKSEFRFAAIPNLLGLAPVQCGGNAWEEDRSVPEQEATNVSKWITSNGASATETGFTYKVGSFAVCAACQCPRGDRAVVLPADASSTSKLASLGFASIAGN